VALRRHSSVRHLHAVESHDSAPTGIETPLIERAVELEALHSAVARLVGGDGGVVVLEAAAGLGKTVLLEHAGQHAAQAGIRVRTAAPGPLERHFPFGVVRTLLEAPLRDASEAQRARLLDGAAAPQGPCCSTARSPAATARR
jgi:hypothetical protein